MDLLIIKHLGKNCTGVVMDYLKDPPKLPFLEELLNQSPRRRLYLDLMYSNHGISQESLEYVRRNFPEEHLD